MNQLTSILAGVVVASLVTPNAMAGEAEAAEVFTTAVQTALTFRNARMIDEIAASFPHFTTQGREAVIEELGRTGIVREATKKNGSLKTRLDKGSLQATTQVNESGLNEYEFTGKVYLQWQRCIERTCAPVGEEKAARAKGVVKEMLVNGRPSYQVNSLILDGATHVSTSQAEIVTKPEAGGQR